MRLIKLNNGIRILRLSSKGKRELSLKILNSKFSEDFSNKLLSELIKINPSQKHIDYLSRFCLDVFVSPFTSELEMDCQLNLIGGTYRYFENITGKKDDISQFSSYWDFYDYVSSLIKSVPSKKNSLKAIKLDKTNLKEHVGTLIKILNSNSNFNQVKSFYNIYLELCESNSDFSTVFSSFNDFKDLENFVDKHYKGESVSGEIDFSNEVFSNNEVEVYYADTVDRAKELSKGYGFCIGWEKDNQFWNYRLSSEERSFYFVKMNNRTDNSYIVVQRLNNGGLRWTNSSNDNGDEVVSEEKLKNMFPELSSISFDSVFKHVPLTEEERKFAQSVQDRAFESFAYEDKTTYISYGHDLTKNQFSLCDKDQKRYYINSINRFLPNDMLDLIKDDASLMKTYEKKCDVIKSVIKDSIMESGEPPTWAYSWLRENKDNLNELNPEDFLPGIKEFMSKGGYPPDWCIDWAKDNIHLFFDVLIKDGYFSELSLYKSWFQEGVEKIAFDKSSPGFDQLSEAISLQIREWPSTGDLGFIDGWADWALVNLDDKKVQFNLRESISDCIRVNGKPVCGLDFVDKNIELFYDDISYYLMGDHSLQDSDWIMRDGHSLQDSDWIMSMFNNPHFNFPNNLKLLLDRVNKDIVNLGDSTVIEDYVHENPEHFLDGIIGFIKKNGYPPNFASNWVVENGIFRSKNDWLSMVRDIYNSDEWAGWAAQIYEDFYEYFEEDEENMIEASNWYLSYKTSK